jgi:hypothetical protein
MNPKEMEVLEEMLRRMPLRQPSKSLDRRVRAARPRALRLRRWFVWGGALTALAAAAALLIAGASLVGVPIPGFGPADEGQLAGGAAGVEPEVPGAAPAQEARRDGIRIEQVWSALAANDVVMVDDAQPMRRVQRQVYRRVQWIDPERDVRIEWNIPSEQSVLVPLEYN